MTEIEQTFDKYLEVLKAVRKTILDVKMSNWHDEYNKFRTGLKDLEVMVQNVINTGFKSITSVEEGVQLLEVFAHFTTREVSLSAGSIFVIFCSILGFNTVVLVLVSCTEAKLITWFVYRLNIFNFNTREYHKLVCCV